MGSFFDNLAELEVAKHISELVLCFFGNRELIADM